MSIDSIASLNAVGLGLCVASRNIDKRKALSENDIPGTSNYSLYSLTQVHSLEVY
jgi:hypothetical protein